MNTRDIIAIRKVCELGNLSKAAGELFITPQALSLTVKKMENELGVPLFNRVTGGMELTRYGKIFFDKSETLLRELEEMEEMFRLDEGNKKGVIRLAVALGIIAAIMPETIWKFSDIYPNFQINVIEGTDTKVEELVRNETVDLGIAKGPVDEEEFDVIPWCQFPQCALVNKESPFAKKFGRAKEISILDLKDVPLIVENKDFKVYSKLKNLCGMWGFQPKIYFETTEIALAHDLADAGKGVAITPKNAIDLLKHENLQLMTFEEDFTAEWCFIKKKGLKLSEVENHFINYLFETTGFDGMVDSN